CARWQSGCDYW
nr:immunoglobulin heavy chain junction region [Macaca mulatta]